jgi:hypothetical protein
MDLIFSRRPASVAFVLLFAMACGGGSKPATTTPGTTPPTTVASGPTPTPPPAASGCPLGYGSGRFTCQGDVPGLLPQVDAAIDKLVAQRPDLFNLDNPPATGAYGIKDLDAFYAGILGNLQAAGMCGQVDPGKDTILVKENNSYAERYDIVTAQGYIRRGEKTYIVTCTPANFPLTEETAVASVAVSFFRVNCGGVTVPLASLPFNSLPLACIGTITATPRDSVGNKLPLVLHGPDVVWSFQGGEGEIVAASPDDEIPFNVRLYPRALGDFRICATVQDRTGCLQGHVVP